MRYSNSQEDLSVWQDTNELCFEEVSTTSSSLGSVLQERGSRYGEFKDNADISQQLKSVMYSSTNYYSLPNDMKESLQMIAHKIARILEGDPYYDDSWVDIAGYAKLVANRLQGVSNEPE